MKTAFRLLLLISALQTVAPKVSTAQGVIYTFESGTDHWRPSTNVTEQGIDSVYQSMEMRHSGQGSLAMQANLIPGDAQQDHGSAEVFCPGNLSDSEIIVWVYFPEGTGGDPDSPNGVQIFVKDNRWRSLFGTRHNIGANEEIAEDTWVEIRLRVNPEQPDHEFVEDGFDPTRITLAGVRFSSGRNSTVSYRGVVFIDDVQVNPKPLTVPESDHLFVFDSLTSELQQTKPFGYGPYWDIDTGWAADAWDSEGITADSGRIAINAVFDMSSMDRDYDKGFVAIELKPHADIEDKLDRVLRAAIQFEPYVGPSEMVASFWVFDRHDAGPDFTWYRSIDMPVGGDRPMVVEFDLSDSTQHHPSSLGPPADQGQVKNILKVGVQIFSNVNYTGKIFLDNIALGAREDTTRFEPAFGDDEFIVTQAGDFQNRSTGEPFFFAGDNVFYLFQKSHFMIDQHMEMLARNNLSVVRTWGFSDGLAPFAQDGDTLANGNEGNAFHPHPGLYYEPTFLNFDYVLKSAVEHGIRVIVPLVNHWSDVDKRDDPQNSYGGMAQYLEWCGIPLEYDGSGHLSNKDLFYTEECPKAMYMDYVEHMITRRNRLTGRFYAEEPGIFAWELANEPRSRDTSGSTLHQWVTEMAQFIKSLDPRHMVAVGDEGFFRQPGRSEACYNGSLGVDWSAHIDIPTIDIATVHAYPENYGCESVWTDVWFLDHIHEARSKGKPIIFEEFGVRDLAIRDSVYNHWTDLFFEERVDGDLVWMLAGIQDDGTLFPDVDGFTFGETSSTAEIIRRHARMMNGIPTGVATHSGSPPSSFELSPNYPNPFNAVTRIGFSLRAPGRVKLSVYDMLGRTVQVLVDGHKAAGRHEVVFDGSGLPSGVYFYRLQAAASVQTRKFVMLR